MLWLQLRDIAMWRDHRLIIVLWTGEWMNDRINGWHRSYLTVSMSCLWAVSDQPSWYVSVEIHWRMHVLCQTAFASPVNIIVACAWSLWNWILGLECSGNCNAAFDRRMKRANWLICLLTFVPCTTVCLPTSPHLPLLRIFCHRMLWYYPRD